jgi:ketosteroid isomerase-like protein
MLLDRCESASLSPATMRDEPTTPWSRSYSGVPSSDHKAMSKANVTIVQDAFRAFNTHGIDAALSFFGPDVVWYTTDRWVDGSAYRGHDGVRTLTAAFAENFDDLRFEVSDVHDAQDRVVALIHMTGQIKGSESRISQTIGLVVSDFRSGTFGEVRAFATWDDALKAVELDD